MYANLSQVAQSASQPVAGRPRCDPTCRRSPKVKRRERRGRLSAHHNRSRRPASSRSVLAEFMGEFFERFDRGLAEDEEMLLLVALLSDAHVPDLHEATQPSHARFAAAECTSRNNLSRSSKGTPDENSHVYTSPRQSVHPGTIIRTFPGVCQEKHWHAHFAGRLALNGTAECTRQNNHSRSSRRVPGKNTGMYTSLARGAACARQKGRSVLSAGQGRPLTCFPPCDARGTTGDRRGWPSVQHRRAGL